MPQYFTDANGWTHVRSKRPQLLAKREERIGKAAQDKALNLEKVLNKYRGYVHHWEKSTCYSDTVAIFDNELLKLEDLQITSCLCTGLGSLTRWHDGSPAASFWQVAALETILGLLGKAEGKCMWPLANMPQGRDLLFNQSTSRTPHSTNWTRSSFSREALKSSKIPPSLSS